MRSVAPTDRRDSRSALARTGAPASASTTLVPTERSSVLLPDMFEPLTISTRVAPPIATSLRMQRTSGMSGWPSAHASNCVPGASSSG